MIEAAAGSIWLSSLTFMHPELVPVLEKKARSGVTVTFVAARRTVKGASRDPDIARLVKAGAICRFLDSTHSKALVIDEELVMVGSANAHGGDHDLCVTMRDRRLAAQIIEYLSKLPDIDNERARRR
jgi:hypothetical protein